MKLLLYPHTFENQFLLMNRDPFQITGVVVSAKARTNLAFLERKSIQVHDQLIDEKLIPQYDGLFVYPCGIITETFRQRIICHMEEWIKNGKMVFCAVPLSESEKEQIRKLAGTEKAQERFVLVQSDELFKEEQYSTPFSETDTPVIYIGQVCESAYSKDLTVGLSLELKKRGYTISTILDDPCAELMGMMETPAFIKRAMDEESKIYYLNNHIRLIEKQYKPDAIVVQVPGVAMRLHQQIKAGFGVYNFYYSNAFLPDVYFLSCPENFGNAAFVEQFNQILSSNYGYGIDGIWRTNFSVDPEQLEFGEYGGKLVKTSLNKDIIITHGNEILVCSGIAESIFMDFADQAEKILCEEEIEVM